MQREGGGPRPGQATGKRGRRRGLSVTALACICVCVYAAVCVFRAHPSSFSSSPPPPLLPASLGCPPLSLEQQQQQQWSFTASPRLAVREYTSGEQNGYGREPEQPVLRHGQLPPRPLVTLARLSLASRPGLSSPWTLDEFSAGAEPRRDKRRARCVCLCMCVCACVMDQRRRCAVAFSPSPPPPVCLFISVFL